MRQRHDVDIGRRRHRTTSLPALAPRVSGRLGRSRVDPRRFRDDLAGSRCCCGPSVDGGLASWHRCSSTPRPIPAPRIISVVEQHSPLDPARRHATTRSSASPSIYTSTHGTHCPPPKSLTRSSRSPTGRRVACCLTYIPEHALPLAPLRTPLLYIPGTRSSSSHPGRVQYRRQEAQHSPSAISPAERSAG